MEDFLNPGWGWQFVSHGILTVGANAAKKMVGDNVSPWEKPFEMVKLGVDHLSVAMQAVRWL